jgi:hypothetical protein
MGDELRREEAQAGKRWLEWTRHASGAITAHGRNGASYVIARSSPHYTGKRPYRITVNGCTWRSAAGPRAFASELNARFACDALDRAIGPDPMRLV